MSDTPILPAPAGEPIPSLEILPTYGIGTVPPMTLVECSGRVFSLRDLATSARQIEERLCDQIEPGPLFFGNRRTVEAMQEQYLEGLWRNDRLSNQQWTV